MANNPFSDDTGLEYTPENVFNVLGRRSASQGNARADASKNSFQVSGMNFNPFSPQPQQRPDLSELLSQRNYNTKRKRNANYRMEVAKTIGNIFGGGVAGSIGAAVAPNLPDQVSNLHEKFTDSVGEGLYGSDEGRNFVSSVVSPFEYDTQGDRNIGDSVGATLNGLTSTSVLSGGVLGRGGGCVISTALHNTSKWTRTKKFRAVQWCKNTHHDGTLRGKIWVSGYHSWGSFVVNKMKKYPLIFKWVKYFADAFVSHEIGKKKSFSGWFAKNILLYPMSYLLGTRNMIRGNI